MVKKFKYAFLLSILFVIGICTHSFARITTNDPTVNSGETVTITINSQEPVASGAINISQNSGLIFKNLSGGTANGTLVAFSKTNNSTSGIATYTFTAPEVSKDTVYKVIFSSQDMADENGNTISNSTATATVTVKAKASTDNNGNTSSGTETPKPDPEPQKGTVTECRINGIKVNQYLNVKNKDTVPVKVTTSTKEGLKIYNDKTKKTYNAKSGQSINVQVVEGEQTLTITLDTGYKTTRRIISTKEAEETEPNVIEEPKTEDIKVILKSLTIKGVKLATEEDEEEEKIDLILTPEFSSEVYEYTLDIPEEQNDITKLDIEAIGDKEDFTVEITGNEELVDGENIITILVKSKDGEKTAEYKIIVNKVAEVVEADTQPIKDEIPNTGVEDNSKDMMKLIIGGVIVLIAVVSIIIVIIKFRKKEDDEETEIFDDMDLGDNEVKRQEEKVDYEMNYNTEENDRAKGIDFTGILKNKIEEKSEISNRQRMRKENGKDIDDTFEELKEENTSSKRKGKHF